MSKRQRRAPISGNGSCSHGGHGCKGGGRARCKRKDRGRRSGRHEGCSEHGGGASPVEIHSARRYLYALGQSLAGSEPTGARLEAVDAGILAEALAIVGIAGDFGLAERVAKARQDLGAARSLYTRLFVGPATPQAMPWESTYRSRSRALFRQETLEVRNAYRAQGFLPQAYPKVADDHLALELGFLAALAGRAVDALQGKILGEWRRPKMQAAHF